MRKILSRVVLSLLLLLAQQGAMLHELSHLAEPQAQQERDRGDQALGGVCSDCLVFSQVGIGPLPDLAPPELLSGLAFHPASGSAAAGLTPDLPAQRSRGPPALL